MRIRLVVNADDYGCTPGVSAGIREAHQRGIVTSTTAMMNSPGVEQALGRAMEDCPELGLGVHLVLTAGRPVLPTALTGSLTGGGGAFLRRQGLARVLSALDPGELAAEWRAQVERFAAATGRPPDHLDAHHHVAYWTPLLLRAMLELAQEYRCAVRWPAEAEVGGDLPLGQSAPLARWASALLDEFRPRHPDRFVDSFFGPSATLEELLGLLERLPPGTTELMTHPGHADAELLRGSGYHRQREAELAILTHAAVLAQVRAAGIERITFAQLG